jgi:pyruvate dehydrogenase E2 component (dihydrolipoamide acetyltransferase)
MPVFKDANLLSSDAIDAKLREYEEKAQNGTMGAADMEGSTFGISNLGMLGVERFDAMINKNDSAIAAIGTAVDNRLSVTLTLDHRLINGYQAALFLQTLKKLAADPKTWKE